MVIRGSVPNIINQGTTAAQVVGSEVEAQARKNQKARHVGSCRPAGEAASRKGAAQMLEDEIFEDWGIRWDTNKVNTIDSSF